MPGPEIPVTEPLSLELLYEVTSDDMRTYVAERLRDIYPDRAIEDEDVKWGFSYDKRGRLMLDMEVTYSYPASDEYDDLVDHEYQRYRDGDFDNVA